MALEKDSRWERRSWPELKRLAEEVPEAGIHFQSTPLHPTPFHTIHPTNNPQNPVFFVGTRTSSTENATLPYPTVFSA